MLKYIFAILILDGNPGFAFENNDVNKTALKDTKSALRNSDERQKAVNASPEAKAADALVKATSLGDKATSEEIYGIAGSLMEWLVAESNGDPQKMMQLIQEAKANPQKFYQRIPSSEQKRIEKVADHIGSTKSKNENKKAAP